MYDLMSKYYLEMAMIGSYHGFIHELMGLIKDGYKLEINEYHQENLDELKALAVEINLSEIDPHMADWISRIDLSKIQQENDTNPYHDDMQYGILCSLDCDMYNIADHLGMLESEMDESADTRKKWQIFKSQMKIFVEQKLKRNKLKRTRSD